MFNQALKEAGKPLIPLRPVVISRSGVELVLKMAFFEQRSELAIHGQQPFLFAASEKKVWRACRFCRLGEHQRIVFLLRLAIPFSENRAMTAPLLQPLNGEWPARNIKSRT